VQGGTDENPTRQAKSLVSVFHPVPSSGAKPESLGWSLHDLELEPKIGGAPLHDFDNVCLFRQDAESHTIVAQGMDVAINDGQTLCGLSLEIFTIQLNSSLVDSVKDY